MNNDELEERYQRVKKQVEDDKKYLAAINKLEGEIEDYCKWSSLPLRHKRYIEILDNDTEIDFEQRLNELSKINLGFIEDNKADTLFTHAYEYTLLVPKQNLESKHELIASLVFRNSDKKFQDLILSHKADFSNSEFAGIVESVSNGIHCRIFKNYIEDLLATHRLEKEQSNTIPMTIEAFGLLVSRLNLKSGITKEYPSVTGEQLAKILIDITKISLTITPKSPASLRKIISNPRASYKAESICNSFLKRHGLNK